METQQISRGRREYHDRNSNTTDPEFSSSEFSSSPLFQFFLQLSQLLVSPLWKYRTMSKSHLFLLLLLYHCMISNSLIIHLHPSPEDVFTKTFLLPVQIPRLLQDPQNVPRNFNRSFGLLKGGQLIIDLSIRKSIIFENFANLSHLPLPVITDGVLITGDASSSSGHLWRRSIPKPFGFLSYFLCPDSHQLDSQLTSHKTISSTVWVGLSAGIRSALIALQGLGGGIAEHVLKKQMVFPSPIIGTSSIGPGSGLREIGVLAAIKLLATSVLGVPQSEDSELPQFEDRSIQQTVLPPHTESNATFPPSFRISQFSDQRINQSGQPITGPSDEDDADQVYLLMMTEDQWVGDCELVTRCRELNRGREFNAVCQLI